MANTDYGINVNVNFNAVSYDSTTQTWSGSPTWTIAPPTQGVPPVKIGTDTSTVTWNLNASAVPRGFTASFASPGVAFTGTPAWTGGTPANSNSTTCVADDSFDGLTNNQVFEYVVTVTLSNGTVSNSWNSDPDVENESGTVNVAAMVHTRK